MSAPDPLVQALSRRRQALGRSQRWVARKVGMTQGALSLWESGDREPRSIDSLRRWAQVLGYRLTLTDNCVTVSAAAPAERTKLDPLFALLRQRRHELGLTQLQVATRLGLLENRLGQWESGARQPQTIDHLRRWAGVLGFGLTLAMAAPTPRRAGAPGAVGGRAGPRRRSDAVQRVSQRPAVSL